VVLFSFIFQDKLAYFLTSRKTQMINHESNEDEDQYQQKEELNKESQETDGSTVEEENEDTNTNETTQEVNITSQTSIISSKTQKKRRTHTLLKLARNFLAFSLLRENAKGTSPSVTIKA
jgi:hypothetical protein